MIYYLNFPDEATAISLLPQYRVLDEQGQEQWLTGSHEHALYVVGNIYIAPDTVKYGDKDFPELKAEVAAKVVTARAELAAKVAEPTEGELAEAVEDIPVMVKSDGFHVNLICPEGTLSPEALAYTVVPQFPKVVWA